MDSVSGYADEDFKAPHTEAGLGNSGLYIKLTILQVQSSPEIK